MVGGVPVKGERDLGTRAVQEATTIEFPRDVSDEESVELFGYIVNQLGEHSRINANFSGHINAQHGKREGEKYVSQVGGLVSHLSEGQMVVAGFSLIRSERDLIGKFSGLRFEPPVGYELDEVDLLERGLYDKVREISKGYFGSYSTRKRHIRPHELD